MNDKKATILNGISLHNANNHKQYTLYRVDPQKGTECLEKESGYALYTVLIILTIAAIFLTITFRNIGFTRIQTALEIQKIQANLLARSGIIRAEYFLNGGDGHSIDWETDKFKETIENYGSIILKNKRFGLFPKIESQGVRLNTTSTITGLFGRDIPKNMEPALTLTGHVGGLILYQGSSIDGSIVLHHGGVYHERGERALFEYQKVLTIRESPPLPFDHLLIINLFEKLDKTKVSLLCSKYALTGNITIGNLKDSTLKRENIVVLGDCRIENGSLIDKTIVVSGMLTVNNNAVIQGCQVFAEKINVENGTSECSIFYSTKNIHIKGGYHNSQFFSKDTIFCEKGVNFQPMSVISCLQSIKNNSIVTGGIIFEAGTRFKGTVITCRDSSAKKIISGPAIVFGRGCSLSGAIITDHDVDLLEITIKGNVWARSITASDSGKSYTNFFIKSKIQKPDEPLFFPLIGELPAKIRVNASRIIVFTKGQELL